MLRNAILGAALVVPTGVYAQLSEMSRDSRSGNLNNGYSLAPPETTGVQGSAFLLPDWVPGKLQFAARPNPLSVPLKYDLYHLELRVKRPAGDSVIVPLEQVREFTLESGAQPQRFVCYAAASLPPDAKGCGEVLYEGPAVQLLKFQRKTIVKKAAENGGYVSVNAVSVLEEQTRYYLRWVAGGQFADVKPRRASLEHALAGQPAALAALKAHKGSIGTEAELAAALAALAPQLR